MCASEGPLNGFFQSKWIGSVEHFKETHLRADSEVRWLVSYMKPSRLRNSAHGDLDERPPENLTGDSDSAAATAASVGI